MLFHQLFDPTSHTYTYLLASGLGKEALLIDPVLEQIPQYLQLLDELHLKLCYTMETHTHADHITAAGELNRLLNSDIVMGAQTQAKNVSRYINDGEKINIGSISLTAIHTPGHTPDSYCFYLEGMLFTGDTLLIGATGRTDFQGGDAFAQYNSIFNKLLTLPGNTVVYPGHDYNSKTTSTIKQEQHTNPRLQVKNATEYANIMTRLNLPAPKLIDRTVAANLNCGLSEAELLNNL